MGQGDNNPKSKIENPESLGRREWLLRLGETAVLMGFSGVVRQARPDASSLAAASPASLQLPPGLYEPSNDHLAHALAGDAQFHPVPAGSETDYTVPLSGPVQSEFLSPPEFKTIRRMVELVIGHTPAPSGMGSADPVLGSAVRSGRQAADDGRSADPAFGSADRADGPGETSIVDEVTKWIDLRLSRAAMVREAALRLAPNHRALAVAYYGSLRVQELESSDPQKTCRDGLRWLEDNSQRSYQQSFLGLNEGQQLELLQVISDEPPGKSQEGAGTRFFHWIKGEIIRGYYTSRRGLSELDYRGNAFYAEPPGCETHGRER